MNLYFPAVQAVSDSGMLDLRSKRSRAFTLVELLAVIVIIGILAAILIPVAGRVRSQAKRSACLSQVRQLGLGLLTYINDNPHRLGPYDARDLGNQDTSIWLYGGKPALFGLLIPYLGLADTQQKTPDLFICPGAQPDRATSLKAATSGLRDTSYWMNPDCSSNPNHAISTMTLPIRRVAIIDYTAWWDPSLWPTLANHGSEGANVFRMDGSAQWIPIEKTQGLPAWAWAQLDKL